MGKREAKHVNAQRNGRKRDRGICQICGSTEHAEGHHAFDYQFGGTASVDNIVTLCHECHKKVHNGDIDIYIV